MKKLYIIRHAKSSWENPLLNDYDRDLNDRWKEDVKIIWKKLKEQKILPDKIFCSPAKRAKKTCKAICEKIWYSFDKVKFDERIYTYHMKWIDFYLSCIKEINNKYDDVFIIGHNNAWNELVAYLLWKDVFDMPTCGVICINFDIDSWEDISDKKWEQEFFIYPKMYY